MRPAYEQLVRALEAQPDRIEEYEWRDIIGNLRKTATPKERLYLEDKLREVAYNLCDIKLSKLLLGITDGPEEESSPYASRNLVHQLSRGKQAARTLIDTSPIVGEYDEYGNLMSKPNPNQMELDL